MDGISKSGTKNVADDPDIGAKKSPLLAACETAIEILEIGKEIKWKEGLLAGWHDNHREETKNKITSRIELFLVKVHELENLLKSKAEGTSDSPLVDELLNAANDYPATVHDCIARSHVAAIYEISKQISRSRAYEEHRCEERCRDGKMPLEEIKDWIDNGTIIRIKRCQWSSDVARVQIEKEYQRAMKLIRSELIVFPSKDWVGISKRRADWVREFKPVFSARTFSRYIKDQILRNRKAGSMIEIHPDDLRKYLSWDEK